LFDSFSLFNVSGRLPPWQFLRLRLLALLTLVLSSYPFGILA